MRKTIISSVFVATVGLAATLACNAATVLDDDELMPTGKGWGQRVPPGLAKQPPGNASVRQRRRHTCAKDKVQARRMRTATRLLAPGLSERLASGSRDACWSS